MLIDNANRDSNLWKTTFTSTAPLLVSDIYVVRVSLHRDTMLVVSLCSNETCVAVTFWNLEKSDRFEPILSLYVISRLLSALGLAYYLGSGSWDLIMGKNLVLSVFPHDLIITSKKSHGGAAEEEQLPIFSYGGTHRKHLSMHVRLTKLGYGSWI